MFQDSLQLKMTRTGIKQEPQAVGQDSPFQIGCEMVRWDKVKTVHDLQDDMEVAEMLLNCYDLVGGSYLVWSDKAKLTPPPLAATLRLQYVSEEGRQVLQEIKALGGWAPTQETMEGENSGKKQSNVRHIVKVEQQQNEEAENMEEQVEINLNEMQEAINSAVQEGMILQGKRPRRQSRQPESDFLYQAQFEDDDDNADDDFIPGMEEEEESNLEEDKPYIPTTPKKTGGPKKGTRPRKVTKTSQKPSTTSSSPKDSKSPKRAKSVKKTAKAPKKPRKDQEDESTQDTESGEKKGKSDKEKVKKKSWSRKTHPIYQCLQCKTMCHSRQEFKEHYAFHTIDGSRCHDHDVSKYASKFFKCLECDKVFDGKKIQDHRNSHHPYTCTICGVKYNNWGNWKFHMDTHEAKESGKRHVCKLCGNEFLVLKLLKDHMRRVHVQGRNFICEVCGKAFKTVLQVNRHRKTHSNIKKTYSCDICGNTFTRKDNLKSHLKIHSSVKPHKCGDCGDTFLRSWNLKKHKQTVHKPSATATVLYLQDPLILYNKPEVPVPVKEQVLEEEQVPDEEQVSDNFIITLVEEVVTTTSVEQSDL